MVFFSEQRLFLCDSGVFLLGVCFFSFLPMATSDKWPDITSNTQQESPAPAPDQQ